MGLSQLCFFAFVHLVSSFLLFHPAFAHFNSSIHPVCHDNERSALLQFKQSLILDQYASSDPSAYPKVASWKLDEENSNCCSWDGIKCDEDTGHVIKLDLASCFLYGSINSSSSLFRLVHLQWLSLADNDFNLAKIPTGIVNLNMLSHLDLSFSRLSGQIPSEILELSRLEYLNISQNSLELQNPSLANLVEKLINVKVLDLDEVEIYSPLPPALKNLSSLTFLSLNGCSLQGTMPSSIGNLTKLVHLDISNNYFQGELPASIVNLRSLSYLDGSSSSFSGKIPPLLGNLTQLHYLELSENGFSGGLPTSLGNLTQLRRLGVSSNNFDGLNSYSLYWIANLKELTILNLPDNNLSGEIPSFLKNLKQLNVLSLVYNQLTGPIPPWLMNLNKLTILYLNFNRLIGHIPVEISNLTKLQSLSLASNSLKGSLPSSIFELKNLQVLVLFSNNLSGTVDLNLLFLNLKSLDVLVLSSNRLSLLTTTSVNTTLRKFFYIGFASCNLSEFPYFLHNQDQLTSLDLSSNYIAGQVPGWLLNVSTNKLKYLNLSYNLLTGFEHNLSVLPWTELATLDLRYNKLQGRLPVPPMSTYSYLVAYNQMTGEIPPRICSLNHLYALDLSYNNLSGLLPDCLGSFSYGLSVLKLQGNNFHGSIPQTFMKGSNLRMIDLSNNSLQGRIPPSLANCANLKFFNLGNNKITDIFPFWLGTLPKLEVLVLKFNNLYGEIKESKTGFEFPKLRIIDLSHNRFTGNLPSKYLQCWNAMKEMNASVLTYLQDNLQPHFYPSFIRYSFSDYSLILSNKGNEMEYQKLSNLITAVILSNNKFMGEIPTSVANLKGLRILNLSSNSLEGHIPSSLVNLTALESLDLSNNKLSGEIPQQLGELTALEAFDVSHNNLTGPIPRGTQFTTFNRSSFDGNPGLCGEPWLKECGNADASQEEDKRSESLFEFGWKIVLIGYASGMIIGLALGHIFSTRKQEWLARTFRVSLKRIERKKRRHWN